MAELSKSGVMVSVVNGSSKLCLEKNTCFNCPSYPFTDVVIVLRSGGMV